MDCATQTDPASACDTLSLQVFKRQNGWLPGTSSAPWSSTSARPVEPTLQDQSLATNLGGAARIAHSRWSRPSMSGIGVATRTSRPMDTRSRQLKERGARGCPVTNPIPCLIVSTGRVRTRAGVSPEAAEPGADASLACAVEPVSVRLSPCDRLLALPEPLPCHSYRIMQIGGATKVRVH